MGLSDIEFTPAEMRELEKAAEESFRRRPHEKARRMPKGAHLVALKQMAKQNDLNAVAVIAGITPQQLQRIVE